MMSISESIAAFKSEGFQKIEGWCYEEMFSVCPLINDIQREKHINGGAAEIGIHHGKFFILLNQFIDQQQTSYAIDLFENGQNLNIDYSGNGSLSAFKANLAKYDRHKGANVKIISEDSTSGSVESSIDKGSIRLFSIDGGHTAEHTVSDLILASKVIANGGVVIADDILNYHWLGVFEGVMKFLSQSPTLVPFAIGYNKLFLSKISYYPLYFDVFNNSHLKTKVSSLLGRPLVAL